MDMQTEAFLQGGLFKRLVDEESAQLREKYGMKRAEMEILYYLSRCGGHNTSKDIRCQLMMNKGHISQVVDSLCRRSLIMAVPDQEDRRYVHYVLLDSAIGIIEEMSRRREEIGRQVFAGVTEEELQTFLRVSGKIRTNITNMI